MSVMKSRQRDLRSDLKDLRDLPKDPISTVTSLSDSGIMKLLNHLLTECFFTWDKTLYKQSAGLPMGGHLSPILANIFMEELEYKVLCSVDRPPKLFFRYVDDIVLV